MILPFGTFSKSCVSLHQDLPYARPVSAVAWHPLDHAAAFGSLEPHSKVQVYGYTPAGPDGGDTEDAAVRQGAAGDPAPEEAGNRWSTAATAAYPAAREQVAKLIRRQGEEGAEDSDREADVRTPVDLQDIVEKLNATIKECRAKKDLALEGRQEKS